MALGSSVLAVVLVLSIAGSGNGVPVKQYHPCLRPDTARWACTQTKDLFKQAIGWHDQYVGEHDRRMNCESQFITLAKDNLALRTHANKVADTTLWLVITGGIAVLAAGMYAGYRLGRVGRDEP